MSIPTEYQKIESKTIEKAQQQAGIFQLVKLAFSDIAPADLMVEAAELIKNALPGDYSLIWELPSGQEKLLLITSAGFGNGLVNPMETPTASETQVGYILASLSPVIVNDLQQETRFKPSSLVLEHGAVSGMGIRIGIPENPYGVIEVFSRQMRSYSPGDLQFLQSVAQVVGLALHGKRCEERLVKENQSLRKELAKAQSVMRSGHFEWDRYDIKKLLIESRERERLRLAQELHDVPIQDLYGLIYQLDDLKDALKDLEDEEIIEECDQTLRRTVDNLRTICRELRPPSLSPFGLEVAIRDHMEKFMDQNPEISVHLELMSDKQVLSDSLRLSLFRLCQEAIRNVARHAQATEVYIRFRWDDKTILLEIEDNGEGFEVPKNWVDLVRDEHFGLLGIAERVDSIRGKLEILSTSGGGTLIRAIVPSHSG